MTPDASTLEKKIYNKCKSESEAVEQRVGVGFVEYRRGWLCLGYSGCLWFLGKTRFDRQVCHHKTASSSKHLSVIDAVFLQLVRDVFQRLRWGRHAEELPMAHKVQGKKVASHAVVQAGIADDKIPFCSG